MAASPFPDLVNVFGPTICHGALALSGSGSIAMAPPIGYSGPGFQSSPQPLVIAANMISNPHGHTSVDRMNFRPSG
jgi:hypothetical protein